MKTINELKNEIRIASFNFSQLENAIDSICRNAIENNLIVVKTDSDYIFENEFVASIEKLKNDLFDLMRYESNRIDLCNELIEIIKTRNIYEKY